MNYFFSKLARYAPLALALAWYEPAFATEILPDPLRAFCWGSSVCANDGTTMPVQLSDQLQFGFGITPGPQIGDLVVAIVIPNDATLSPSSLSFSITGIQGGATNTDLLSGTSTLFSTKAWTKGNLVNYLGLSAQANTPLNPIALWLPLTQAVDPDATGYFVYSIDLGINQLQRRAKQTSGPLLTLSSSFLPEGAFIAGFLEEGLGSIGTANNSPLFAVPEPASLSFLAAGAFGLVIARRRKRARRDS